ncbi:MAG: hypothetical protein COA82_03675 [Alkaliphilus sp.]|nr:MAG: hypothetical protein COA82_03675 [Alkaliphilus sp.]
MTTLEVYIDLAQKLQKVNSNAFKTFLPEEKDWWLSEGQMRFLKRRISPKVNSKQEGNQSTVKRYDDLRALVTSYSTPLTIESSSSVIGNLPYNYYELLNSRTTMGYNCNGASQLPGTCNYYFAAMGIPVEDPVPTTFLKNMIINMVANTTPVTSPILTDLFVLADSPFPNEFASADETYVLTDYLKEVLNDNSVNVQVYWEKYRNHYAKGKFLYIVPQEISPTPIVPQNVSTGIDGAKYETVVYGLIGKNCYAVNTLVDVSKTSANRLVETEFLYDLLANTYFTTRYDSPLITMAGDNIEVHHNSTFLPTSLDMTYYRTPLRFNSTTGQTFEIDDAHHSEIVDLTVQLMLGHMAGESYPAVAQENLFNE